MEKDIRYSIADVRTLNEGHNKDVQERKAWFPTAEYLMGYEPQTREIKVNGKKTAIEINPRLVETSDGNSSVEYRPKLAIPGNGSLDSAKAMLGAYSIQREIQRRITDEDPHLSIEALKLRLVDMAVVPSNALQRAQLESEGLSEIGNFRNGHGTEYALIARCSVVEK